MPKLFFVSAISYNLKIMSLLINTSGLMCNIYLELILFAPMLKAEPKPKL